MSDLLSGYAQYLTFMDEVPLFNTESFIANKLNTQKKFFADFCSTQIFRQFLQNDSKENFPYFYKIENQNKKAIHSNSRQSCLIPRTSVLDVSKFMHFRSHSNNMSVGKDKEEKFRNSDELVGVRFSGNSSNNSDLKKNEKKQKEKSKSKNFYFI